MYAVFFGRQLRGIFRFHSHVADCRAAFPAEDSRIVDLEEKDAAEPDFHAARVFVLSLSCEMERAAHRRYTWGYPIPEDI